MSNLEEVISEAESLYVRLLRYEVDQMVAWAGECLEQGDYGGYARASLRIQHAMKLLEESKP